MADVKQFTLDGNSIDVKDDVARQSISNVSTQVNNLSGRVSTLEGLSRLTVSYNSTAESIDFVTTTH